MCEIGIIERIQLLCSDLIIIIIKQSKVRYCSNERIALQTPEANNQCSPRWSFSENHNFSSVQLSSWNVPKASNGTNKRLPTAEELNYLRAKEK